MSSLPIHESHLAENQSMRKQGRIQRKLEGGAVGSGGAEKFSKIGDESTLYTTISYPFSE